jgi:hypothetical protein
MACAVCARLADATARGWLALRIDLEDEDLQPKLAFYCPECAEDEFDGDGL